MNRGFPNKEFEERIVKVRYLMDKNNIDMLLITSPHNFRYFCGLDSYSESCFTQNQFSINPLSVFHPNEISILYIDNIMHSWIP